MRRLVAGVGAALVVAGLVLAVVATGDAAVPGFGDAVTVLVLAGALLALWKVGRALPGTDDVALSPWVPGGAIVHGEPERTPRDHPLSADEFSGVVAAAGATARREGTVEDGLAVLGPPLREALLDALIQGGAEPAAAERLLRTGEWTDNAWAAYVVEPAVGAPRWTLRQRFRAWLFPEDTVRRLAREAVDGVARAADDALPPVPGQGAPRTVPVTTPSLADLQRGADGELQEAIEPTAIERGPAPPSDHDGLDERFDETPDEDADANGDLPGSEAGSTPGTRAGTSPGSGVGDAAGPPSGSTPDGTDGEGVDR